MSSKSDAQCGRSADNIHLNDKTGHFGSKEGNFGSKQINEYHVYIWKGVTAANLLWYQLFKHLTCRLIKWDISPAQAFNRIITFLYYVLFYG